MLSSCRHARGGLSEEIGMAKTLYRVLLHKGFWRIELGGTLFGPYEAQRDAIRVAIDLANRAGEENADGAQVLVQADGQEYRTEWTFGLDAYPPPA